jgi:DNA polymerase-3 subunit delta
VITVLFGKNSFALAQRKHQIIDEFLAAHPASFGLERYDGAEHTAETIVDALTTMPFLSGERLVIVHDVGSGKELAGQLSRVLDRVPETTRAVFIEPSLAKKGEPYATLAKHAALEEFGPIAGAELSRWLADYAKSRGAVVEPQAVRLLLEHSSDQRVLASEIDKLATYSGQITPQTVGLLVERGLKVTVFEMLDALMAGRTERAIEAFRGLSRARVELGYVIAMLGWQFHLLLTVWAAGDRPSRTIAGDSGFSPFSISKTAGLARRCSRQGLRNALKLLVDLDRRLKSRPADGEAALEATLLRLATVL